MPTVWHPWGKRLALSLLFCKSQGAHIDLVLAEQLLPALGDRHLPEALLLPGHLGRIEDANLSLGPVSRPVAVADCDRAFPPPDVHVALDKIVYHDEEALVVLLRKVVVHYADVHKLHADIRAEHRQHTANCPRSRVYVRAIY
eukprot:scaffold647825_cov40-Prasinocladus_malaysianus.AAC.4